MIALRAIAGLLGFVPGWVYAIGIAALLATNCTTSLRLDKAKLALAEQTAAIEIAKAEAERAARAKEQELQEVADKQRKVRDAKIKSLDLALAAAAEQLRNRPERPSGNLPTVAGTGSGGCAPSQLYRSDAAVALSIAAGADKLRIALEACQAQYTKARESLNGTKGAGHEFDSSR